MGTESIAVREVRDSDLDAVAEIYGYHVRHGVASFEYDPPDAAELRRRCTEVRARGLPYVVAERDSRLLGFAYASPFRLRPAYRYTVEDSVYVHPDTVREGIGRRLLQAVIAGCEAAGRRRLVAVIGGADERSIAFHRRCGFEDAGRIAGAGWKHDRWLDLVLMQRGLGAGTAEPPEGCPPARTELR